MCVNKKEKKEKKESINLMTRPAGRLMIREKPWYLQRASASKFRDQQTSHLIVGGILHGHCWLCWMQMAKIQV